MIDEFKHCDEYTDDETQPAPLRAYLRRAREPAHGHLSSEPYPKLFATYRGVPWGGIRRGDRVRVVMASRMGDVGITKKLEDENGYAVRCAVAALSDFSADA
jgi:hypothetical protein